MTCLLCGMTMDDTLDLTYCLLAARYVRKQARQLAEQLEGVRKADDTEFVHRARVASRRLRAAMRMFRRCFEKRQAKKWRKQIRAVTRGLGDARDKDVQIEFLCGILGAVTDKACAPGIARLLAQLEHERELLQPNVLKAVRRLESSQVLEEMQTVGKEMLAAAKAGAESYGPPACRPIRPFVERHLEDLLQYQESLQRPEDQEQHHAMRIAAKRLRYTLEIAKPAYAEELDDIIDATKKLQTFLGDIHDCDVWQEHLEVFAREERSRVQAHFGGSGRFARLEAGIEYLRAERRNRRSQVFRELVLFWQALKQQGLWERLVRVVESRSRQSGPDVPPASAALSAVLALGQPLAPLAPKPAAPHQRPNGSGPRESRPVALPR
jgi:CHAD domain-containing protein